MNGKLLLYVILLLTLFTLSCEKETLNTLRDQGSGENAEYSGAVKIAGAREYNVENFADHNGNDHDGNDVLPCIILPELPDWPNAYFVTQQVNIRNDRMTFVLSYTGGCRTHGFQLVCTPLQESQPLQVLAQVFHADSGDPCDRWVTEVREFDLTPLKDLYFKLYDTACGEIVINLVDAAPQETPATYRFCRKDSADRQ